MTSNEPKSLLQLVLQFRKISYAQTILAFAFDWGLIAASIAAAIHIHAWPASVLAILIIASRQHALLVLMHEGAHFHLHPNRIWNDWTSNLCAAWPIGISTEAYRAHHSSHHLYTNTAQDPDWGRKVQNPHWQFPKKPKKFWLDFVPYLYGQGLLEMSFALRVLGKSPRKNTIARIFFMTGITVAIVATKSELLFLEFWVTPYLIVLPLLMKIRSIVEHLALPNENEWTASRNLDAPFIERFFFGPHGNNWHLVHHLYPYVPWHQLGKLNQKLKEDQNYRANSYENTSYFLPSRKSVYHDLIAKNEVIRYGKKAA